MNSRFEKLMAPGRIGPVETRNRIIKTGAGTFMWHEDETTMNDAVLAYYESLARGGVGLLIVESPTIDYPRGARWRARYRIDDDKYVKGLSELPKIIHKHGCPTFLQFNHDGPWQADLHIDPDPPFKDTPIAASPVMMVSENDFHNQTPRALSIEEIEEIVDKFASAAVRASTAGFDGVEINAASSHLLHNFLSPYFNRRTDDYGGSLENRARFATSIIKEIKKRLGNDFPVSICINGIELGRLAGINDSECQTAEDARGIAVILQQAGADSIHVRSHWLGYHVGAYLTDVFFYPEPPLPLASFPKEYDATHRGAGANARLSAGMKQVLDIPVIVVGKFDAELGERTLAEGKADFIGMTRRLQADPDYPKKVAEGRLEDIAPCTACENCLGSRRCRINAFMGAPYNTIEPAETKKRVLVVGGGPAGMEAARVAALRGHDVSLYEKTSRLGGLMPLAAMVKGTELEDLPSMVAYLERQVTKLGVAVNLGKEVDASFIIGQKPDAVIMAAGGVPSMPDIPGIDNPRVVSNAKLHKQLKMYVGLLGPRIIRALTGLWMPIGKKVVIIGSGLHGCELGEFLTKRGRQVTIVDTAERPGEGMVDVLLGYLLTWFGKKNVPVINGVKDIAISDNGVEFTDAEGNHRTLPADTIIPASPLAPNLELAGELEGRVPEIYTVGDCREPLLIADAIGTGLRTIKDI
ncbi:MAG: FAD-dependent oxidoreductase [Dehalococcoidales bacterium]|nr:FAD-dependent oxidoreductase [Dehalococcoidales bacterium]